MLLLLLRLSEALYRTFPPLVVVLPDAAALLCVAAAAAEVALVCGHRRTTARQSSVFCVLTIYLSEPNCSSLLFFLEVFSFSLVGLFCLEVRSREVNVRKALLGFFALDVFCCCLVCCCCCC